MKTQEFKNLFYKTKAAQGSEFMVVDPRLQMRLINELLRSVQKVDPKRYEELTGPLSISANRRPFSNR